MFDILLLAFCIVMGAQAYSDAYFHPNSDITVYYPSLATVAYFGLVAVALSCLKNNNTFVRIPPKRFTCFGIHTCQKLNLCLFIAFYASWWTFMAVYTVLYAKDPLFQQGLFVILNISFAFLPISHNTYFGITRGEQTIIHQFISAAALVSVFLKVGIISGHIKPDFFIKLFNDNASGSPIAGTIATIVTILSPFPMLWRAKFFEWFFIVHRCTIVVVVISSVFHYFVAIYFLTPVLLLYFADIYCRCRKVNKGMYTKIVTLGNAETYFIISITLEKKLDVYPGCYFLICFENISSLEWHPFSLVTRSRDNYVFCAKNMGGNSWTNRLKQYQVGTDLEKVMGDVVYVQGPYGSVLTDYSSDKYAHILFVCSSTAITMFLSVIDHIIKLKLDILETMTIVWITKDTTLVKYFQLKLRDIIAHNPGLFNLQIFITHENQTDHHLPFKLTYHRPQIPNIITKFAKNKKRATVLVAGTDTVIKDAKETCVEISLPCEVISAQTIS